MLGCCIGWEGTEVVGGGDLVRISLVSMLECVGQ